MFLRFRPALASDLQECLPLGRDAFAFEGQAREDLLRMWRCLFDWKAAYVIVIEDRDRPKGASIVYFSFTVFLTPAFAEEALGCLPPCLTTQALARWKGGPSPFLTLEQIRAANSLSGAGLDVACLHSGYREPFLRAEEGRAVRDKVAQVFLPNSAGYRINRFFIESYSEFEVNWSLTAGIPVGNDYAWHESGGVMPPSGQKACLMSVSREQALANEGCIIGTLFTYEPPRFGFTAAQQEMLLWAMLGDTDAELAETLCVADITIGKRWQSIYDRITEVMPEFFGASDAARDRRGAEKKRRALNYLRVHQEELRPHLAPTRRS